MIKASFVAEFESTGKVSKDLLRGSSTGKKFRPAVRSFQWQLHILLLEYNNLFNSVIVFRNISAGKKG